MEGCSICNDATLTNFSRALRNQNETIQTLNAYFQVQENAAAKRMFFASYAKNPEKMLTYLCFGFTNKQDIVVMGKWNLNLP